MGVHTIQYVEYSDLFEGLSGLQDLFCSTWDPFSGATVALVTPADLEAELTSVADDEHEDELNTLSERIKALPEGVYVDLSN